jgi:hypothetical protein
MDQRLLSVESQTCKISDNITALMQHLNVPTNTKRRKDNTLLPYSNDAAEHALHSASSDQDMGDTHF